MSIFKKKHHGQSGLKAFSEALQTNLVNRRTLAGITPAQVSGFVGLESASYTPTDSANVESIISAGWAEACEQAATFLGAGFQESLTAAQKEAAQVIMAGAANPAVYARQALTFRNTSMEMMNIDVRGVGGEFDFRDSVHEGLESFDNTSLTQYIGYSIAFNMQAARQDDFSENFYPTTVVTPDQGGIEIAARLDTVFNEVRHSLTAVPTDFQQKNIINAIVDYTVLAADSLKIVPYYLSGTNSSVFVSTSRVPSRFVTVDNVSVETAALALNAEVDLLGVSQHPGLMASGVMDNTDALDGKIILQSLYIAFAGTGTEEVVKFDTSKLGLSHFNKTPEGRGRKMGLQFETVDLVLNNSSVDIAGGNLDVFDAWQTLGYTLRLKVAVYGSADTEYGTVRLNASPVEIAGIYDANGTQVSTSATGVAAATTAMGAMTVIGYDLDARRTNSNRRTRGLLCNTQVRSERYNIPIGSPLSIPTPINSDTEAADITTLVNAARIRNSNMAVTALLNYADTLKQFASGPALQGVEVPNIMGIGRYWMTPYYSEELNIQFSQRINSIQSHQRIADLRAAMVATVRKNAYAMLQGSRYKVALDQLTGFTGKRPHLLIGTDQKLAQYLMADGDSRTIGPDIEYTVVVSYDARIQGSIFMTFTRPDETGPSPLNFGVHAWVPEMTSAVQVNRNNAYSKEVMVQPRNVHINTLPVLTKLTVDMTDLESVIETKTKAPQTI